MESDTQVDMVDETDMLSTQALGEEGEDVPDYDKPEMSTQALGEEGEDVPDYDKPTDGGDPWDNEPWSPHLYDDDVDSDELDLGDYTHCWDVDDLPDAL